MSNEITLEDIYNATAARFAALTLNAGGAGKLTLRNPLRLSKDERAELTALYKAEGVKEGEEGSADQVEFLRKLFHIVADDKQLVDRVLERIGDDLGVLFVTAERYMATVKPGEA